MKIAIIKYYGKSEPFLSGKRAANQRSADTNNQKMNPDELRRGNYL